MQAEAGMESALLFEWERKSHGNYTGSSQFDQWDVSGYVEGIFHMSFPGSEHINGTG